MFAGWQQGMPATIQICGVQLPGRESRIDEAPPQSLAALLDALDQALTPLLNMPFGLFGHSFGAWLAFHFAMRIRGRGGPGPCHLFAAGCRAPQCTPRHPPIAHLPDAEFLTEVQRRYGAFPREILAEAELLQTLLSTCKADVRLMETTPYEAKVPLNCPISVFGGVSDEFINAGELEAWRSQTIGPFRLQMFPGGHFFVRSARAALTSSIARQLQHLAC